MVPENWHICVNTGIAYLLTQAVLRLRDKAASKRLGGCMHSNDKTPRASLVACASECVGCGAGEAGAGSVVGGVAAVTDERPDVGGNRAVSASTGDSVAVSGVVTEGEGDADTHITVFVMCGGEGSPTARGE